MPFFSNKIIRERIVVFTNINLALCVLIYYKPMFAYVDYDFLYSICYCWNYLIFFTFNGAYFVDNSCFRRLARRKNMSMLAFHSGNFVVHWITFICVNIYLPNDVNYFHSCLGCFINILWCYYVTHGTFDIDHVYVSMTKEKQLIVYAINISSILYAPLAYKLLKHY